LGLVGTANPRAPPLTSLDLAIHTSLRTDPAAGLLDLFLGAHDRLAL
jgi:hypothetical protein